MVILARHPPLKVNNTLEKSDINNKLRKEDGVLLNLPFPYLQQRHWSFLIICIVFGVLDQLEII